MIKIDALIIYDGVCNLCDASVNFILKHEKEARLSFTHLDSELSQDIKKKHNISEDFDSILFLENGILYHKSKAIFKISPYLKFPFSLLSYFNWFPLFISDAIYDFIAKNRYKWFGKDECIIPSQEFRKRFI